MPLADLGDLQLNYRRRGEGPPVLGIMGFALDQRYWGAQTPTVTETHSFITFDNRGLGWSTGEPPTSIDQMADDAVRLLDHLEIERAVIFGVSMGGAIAQRLAIAHPDRVDALVLAITFGRVNEFMRRQHEVSRKLIGLDDQEAFVQASLLRMFTPRFFEVGREVIDYMVAALDRPGEAETWHPDVLLAQLDSLDAHDALAELQSIRCPTLVIGAKVDMIVPGFASEEIADAIPQSELVMLETGHGCMIEEMEEFNAALQKFLASLA